MQSKPELGKIIDFRVMGDERGSLIALELNHNVPFQVKRVYYIYGTKSGVSRGFHAHKSLKQILIAVSGSCRVLLDDGRTQQNFMLDSPDKGLLVGDMLWREMHDFSSDCVLMVVASEHFNEADYIRSYDDFVKLVKP